MAPMQRIRRTYRQFLGATLMLLATTLAAPHHAAAAVAEPTIVGPIPVTTTPGVGQVRNYPFFATAPQFNLTLAGYREEEFFIEGTASRYQTPSMADAILISSGHNYRTSMIVRSPVDPAKFNGIVLVEWVNVTSGYGVDLHWHYSREFLTREGYIHVALQTQRVGVQQTTTGLRDWSPTRYSTLDVTAGGTINDDSLSYDILSQAVQAFKGANKAKILGPLQPLAVFAVGQSTGSAEDASAPNPVLRRIDRARALAAAHQLQSAEAELENVRASVNDATLRNVATLMLLGIYLEDGTYGRAQSLLEEAFQARASQTDESIPRRPLRDTGPTGPVVARGDVKDNCQRAHQHHHPILPP